MAEFVMCPDCIKQYGEHVMEKYTPFTSEVEECCGEPEDCDEYAAGNCKVVED